MPSTRSLRVQAGFNHEGSTLTAVTAEELTCGTCGSNHRAGNYRQQADDIFQWLRQVLPYATLDALNTKFAQAYGNDEED